MLPDAAAATHAANGTSVIRDDIFAEVVTLRSLITLGGGHSGASD